MCLFDFDGTLHASRHIRSVHAEENITGTVDAGANLGGDQLSSGVTAGGYISLVEAGASLDGVASPGGSIIGSAINAGTYVGSVLATEAGGSGGDISGVTITAGTHIDWVAAGKNVSGSLEAGTYVGSVSSGPGSGGSVSGFWGAPPSSFTRAGSAIDCHVEGHVAV